MIVFGKSRKALVTGAGAADVIGIATARALGEAGLSVVITASSARVEQRAEELRAEGLDVRALVADLTLSGDVERLRSDAGEIDILVNNAGMGTVAQPALQRRFVDLSESDWDRGIDVSLKTAFLSTRGFLAGMMRRGHGRVVNMASVTGPYVSNEGEAVYSVAKAGMVGLTHAL
ncbi:MAG: SDR family NAD(P)-dependent oxidoreductase, partial [Mesorhizobium sp.]|nr:SDR family NAD(P)-dependent oxidoreductase [Mesorhizobium sp.]